jgi:superfamily II DNA or RNA helicase
MSFTGKFSRYFTSAVRSRGQDYFRSRLVKITKADHKYLEAKVHGSENYKVIFKVRGKELEVSCTCPYFDEDYCKHLWATMLAAEAQGYLYEASREVTQLVMADSYDDEDDDYDDFYDEEEDSYEMKRARVEKVLQRFQPVPMPPMKKSAAIQPKPQLPTAWKRQLDGLGQKMAQNQAQVRDDWKAGRQVLYAVDVPDTLNRQGLVVEVLHRDLKKNGEWGKLQKLSLTKEALHKMPEAADKRIAALLVGAQQQDSYGYGYYNSNSRFKLEHPLEQILLPIMCDTGRCHLKLEQPTSYPQTLIIEPQPLDWDDGESWQFWVEITSDEAGENYLLTDSLRRGNERRSISEPALVVSGGLVFFRDHVARFDDGGAFAWVLLFRKEGTLIVHKSQRDELLEKLLAMPQLPPMELPEELRVEEVRLTPQPIIKFKKMPKPSYGYWDNNKLLAEVAFDYDGTIIEQRQARRGIFQAEARRYLLRDEAFEQAAADRLDQLGVKLSYSYYQGQKLELSAKRLPKIVKALVAEGWRVEAEGKLYRQAGNFNIQVSSGIDWFDVNGSMDFGGVTAKLPKLLEALKRGENTVMLDDGTFGLLPEEWLKKYEMLAGLGEAEDTGMRFRRAQAGLLDALLATQPEASFDEGFLRAREELRTFEGVQPLDPPAGFVGTLREYQREGLGWLHFLQKFGFGGCLADDMGLGKTVEVLSLLELRRQQREMYENGSKKEPKKNDASVNSKRSAPSLVVVPKSLVFNWKAEAARFTPKLRILDHTGGFRRKSSTEHFDEYDLVITTYGTLRNDVIQLKDFQFDYVILDESQAIKNAATEQAKAVRLLRGDYRLALSGTPIENHLGELWSLFEFLNPGLLGSASVFKLGGAGGKNVDEETRELLAKGLRPFILRRTKSQVAKDLPEKLEQTIYCELDTKQRKLYDELREHYRQSLLGLVDTIGIQKSKIQVLEALLRLRQAACHPGLIDKTRNLEPSAKLDLLIDQLAELHDEDHKTLVFSQFTSFLAIVKNRLDREGITYEYLDGRTRNRAERVERFQTDANCKLFLISLKAGGLGLNLTAAEYVFLLDPWWNPAVEAQAIDRAHRIGQTQKVFAYRLIARDTVEEKVLQLQNTKRELADAIINADNSLIRSLGRDDLELLLS